MIASGDCCGVCEAICGLRQDFALGDSGSVVWVVWPVFDCQVHEICVSSLQEWQPVGCTFELAEQTLWKQIRDSCHRVESVGEASKAWLCQHRRQQYGLGFWVSEHDTSVIVSSFSIL